MRIFQFMVSGIRRLSWKCQDAKPKAASCRPIPPSHRSISKLVAPSDAGVAMTHTSPYFSHSGSSVREDRPGRMPGKQRSSGIPLTLPDRSYVQAWYGQENTRAVPDPSATLAPRCRHTFKKARSLPSRARAMRIGTPRWSSVRKAPGVAHSEAHEDWVPTKQNLLLAG